MLPDEENSKSYNCDGETTSFPITFNFMDDDTICAWIRNISTKLQDPLVNPDDFSIDGKNLITVDTWDTGYKLLMMRAEPQEQTLSLDEEGPMPSGLLEARVDKLTMMVQDLAGKLKRALLLPETYPGDSLIFPEPNDKHFLEWQSGVLQNTQHVSGVATSTEYIKTLLDDPDASTARSTLDVAKHDEVKDDDGDTKIQVEESADEDKIRFDTGGVERMVIGATGVSLEFGDLVSEHNPDGFDEIRLKGTADDVGVVLPYGGYFNLWDVDDNDVFNVDDDGNTVISGYLDMKTNRIFNLGTPTGNYDAATKKYVDDLTDPALLDNSMADTLHRHSELSASDGTPDQALVIDAEGNVSFHFADADVGAKFYSGANELLQIRRFGAAPNDGKTVLNVPTRLAFNIAGNEKLYFTATTMRVNLSLGIALTKNIQLTGDASGANYQNTIIFGVGLDARMGYNGTNLFIDPDVVGTGKLLIGATGDDDLIAGNIGIGTADPNQKLTIEGTMSLKEQANANADVAAYGQLWVKTATPNELWFTDDAGMDHQIAYV